MISPRSIQTIMDAVRIEDVVGDFVRLKRRGVNMIGLCPFHNERTPSFNVNPSRNIYKCFGCGEAGDSINFLMKLESMGYADALRWLAKRYNIEVEEEMVSEAYSQQQQEQESLYLANDFAYKFFQQQMWETDYGKSVGLGYFKERGFLEDTIKKWGLGYAPEAGDALVQAAMAAGYKMDVLKKAGLASQNGRDFFRGRVIFPILNLAGKVAAFAGRTMSTEKNQPKYLNTPESEIYHKSKILYGAHFGRNAIRKLDECWLVEGYTDVMTLHQAGIENVVASSGTALTVEQIGIIKRLTPNLTILYDGDAAGVKAALRGLDLVLEQDMNVRSVLLPGGEDPDSYLRNSGATVFEEYVADHKQDVILFKTGLLLEEVKGDPIKRSALVRDIVGSIAKIPDEIKRSVFIKECSRRLDIDEQALVNEMNKLIKVNIEKKFNDSQKEAQRHSQEEPFPDHLPPAEGEPIGDDFVPTVSRKKISEEFQEKDIIRILMEFGDKQLPDGNTVAATMLVQTVDLLEEFDNPLYVAVVKEALKAFEEEKILPPDYWLRHPNESVAMTAIDFATQPFSLSPGWEKKDVFLSQRSPEENYAKDLESGFKRFLMRKIRRMRKKNLERIKEASLEDQMIFLRVDMKLQEMEKTLVKELGTVIL